MHVKQLLGSNNPTRYEAASGECASAKLILWWLQWPCLAYIRLNTPAACPPRTAFPATTYLLSKIGDNAPIASCGIVRRASHQQFSEEPGRNATDYAMSDYLIMKKSCRKEEF